MRTDNLDLDVIEARATQATPGPWKRRGDDWIDGRYDQVIAPAMVECSRHCLGGSSRIEIDATNAEFIAASREDVPALVAEVRRLRAEVDRLTTGGIVPLDAILNSAPGPDPDGGVELSDAEFDSFMAARRGDFEETDGQL